MGDNNLTELRNLLNNFMIEMNKQHEEIRNNFAMLDTQMTNIK
jgi:hypothetical protein